MSDDLFDGAYPDPPAARKLTDGERRKARHQAYIAQHLHPLTGSSTNAIPLLDAGRRRPTGLTCGDCKHRVRIHGGANAYPKCELGPATHGPATDVLASWPACVRYEPKEQS